MVCDAPLARIPLFVRAGAIVPTAGLMSLRGELDGEPIHLLVYDGTDGEFSLYNDEGDGYAYETGRYSLMPLRYRCADQNADVLDRAEGQYP